MSGAVAGIVEARMAARSMSDARITARSCSVSSRLRGEFVAALATFALDDMVVCEGRAGLSARL